MIMLLLLSSRISSCLVIARIVNPANFVDGRSSQVHVYSDISLKFTKIPTQLGRRKVGNHFSVTLVLVHSTINKLSNSIYKWDLMNLIASCYFVAIVRNMAKTCKFLVPCRNFTSTLPMNTPKRLYSNVNFAICPFVIRIQSKCMSFITSERSTTSIRVLSAVNASLPST